MSTPQPPSLPASPELPESVRQAIAKVECDFEFEGQFDQQSEINAYAQGFNEAKEKVVAALAPLWPSADGRGKAAREWAAYAKPDSAQSHVRNLVSDILNANTLEDAEAAGRAFLERIISETKQAMDRLSSPSPVAGLPTPESEMKCEGCAATATKRDSEGIPLCEDCYAELKASSVLALDAPETDAVWKACKPKTWQVSFEKMHKHAESLERQLAAARAEVEELRGWKESALAVELEWDAQAVGKLLDLPLGTSIRDGIEPAIRLLHAQLATAKEELTRTQTACSQIAAQRDRAEESLVNARSALAKANAAVEEAKQQKVELDGLKLSIKTHNEQVDMPLTKAIVDGARENGIEFVGRSPKQIVEALRAEITKADVTATAATAELDHVLSDWNDMVKAIGAPTNGTAIAHAKSLVTQLNELAAQQSVPPEARAGEAAAEEIASWANRLNSDGYCIGIEKEAVRAILAKHAPARPTAAREDTARLDWLLGGGMVRNVDGYSSMLHYRIDRAAIDASMQQGGKTP